jgi:F0F1-type ATP synthase gamma subunit
MAVHQDIERRIRSAPNTRKTTNDIELLAGARLSQAGAGWEA